MPSLYQQAVPASTNQPRGGGLGGLLRRSIDRAAPSAANTYAGLIRSQFADYIERFRPAELELLNEFDNPQTRQRLQTEAVGLVNQGFDTADQSFRRRNAGLGVTLRPEEEASYQRSQNLGRGLATVDALNRTSSRLRDRDLTLLGGVQRPTV